MPTLAEEFGEVADELFALGASINATLVKAPSDQSIDPTTLQATGAAPTEIPVQLVHMKATASRLSGFNVQIDPEDKTRRLEFYYLRGGDSAIGDVIRFADSSELSIIAQSKVAVAGTAIVYQLLLGA